jgi:AbrB family looped-hinge helix DNA binding protein
MGMPVTVKGQVTIPKPLRDHLGLRPGDAVEFTLEEDGRVVLRKGEAPLDDFTHRIAAVRKLPRNPELEGMSTDEIMLLLRGDPED